MTTYSGEDGMTGTDDPGRPDADPYSSGVEPSPYGADAAGPVTAPPPAYEEPRDAGDIGPTAYNSTDVLPAALAGGRRARREAEEQARTESSGKKPGVTGPPSNAGRVIVPAALAIVSAIALAAAWMHLESDRSAEADAANPPAVVQSPDAATPVATSAASLTPSTTPSTAPTTSPSVVPTTTAAASPTATAKPVDAIDRSVPVVVLNATSRQGLAAKVAASLRAKGWKVTSVGNWTRGGIAETTIFLNGHVAARKTMFGDLPAADGRVEFPLPGMPKLRMIIVLGRDYPA